MAQQKIEMFSVIKYIKYSTWTRYIERNYGSV